MSQNNILRWFGFRLNGMFGLNSKVFEVKPPQTSMLCIYLQLRLIAAERDICRYDMFTNSPEYAHCLDCFQICKWTSWCTKFLMITESQNNSGWKKLQEVSSAISDKKQGSLKSDQVIQGFVQISFKDLQGWRLHNCLNKPFSGVFIRNLIRKKRSILVQGRLVLGKCLIKWTWHIFPILLLKTSISITTSFCLSSSCAGFSSITYKILWRAMAWGTHILANIWQAFFAMNCRTSPLLYRYQPFGFFASNGWKNLFYLKQNTWSFLPIQIQYVMS